MPSEPSASPAPPAPMGRQTGRLVMVNKGRLVHLMVPRPNPAPSALLRLFFRKPQPGSRAGDRDKGPGMTADRAGEEVGRTGEGLDWEGRGRGGSRGTRGRGLFRNGPGARDLDDCLLHILHPSEGMPCARGAAWRFGNGIQRRALLGPDCLLFSDLADDNMPAQHGSS